MSIEAAELMEHFQWLTVEESRTLHHDAPRLHAVTEELADVVCYTLALANELDVDLTDAMRAESRGRGEVSRRIVSWQVRTGRSRWLADPLEAPLASYLVTRGR